MKNEEELENSGLTFVNQLVNIDTEDPNEWAKYGMPFIRRVFPQLMSSKIVGVQPDSVPKFDEAPTQKTWVAPIPVKKNKQPFSLNPGKNYKRKNKW